MKDIFRYQNRKVRQQVFDGAAQFKTNRVLAKTSWQTTGKPLSNRQRTFAKDTDSTLSKF